MLRSAFLVLVLFIGGFAHADDCPHILWITIEDWSPDLSCYGTAGIHTPHVDKLPPYYPDTPFIRRDWANGLEQMQLVDRDPASDMKRPVIPFTKKPENRKQR